MRDVIDFHAVGHVSHAGSLVLELISEEGDAVAALHQALSQLITVSLDTAKLGERKVGDDQHIMLLLRSLFPDHWLHEQWRCLFNMLREHRG